LLVANRRKELAIRVSVGASRFRLVRQMMSEGLLLSLTGGIAGFALTSGLAVLNSRFRPPLTVPEETTFSLDWHAGIFAFGLLQLPGYRRIGLRNLPMVAQVAASLMLLLMTGFLVLGISKGSRPISATKNSFHFRTPVQSPNY
jgi:ABC-type antimicrobial peptide transport system permease subunit